MPIVPSDDVEFIISFHFVAMENCGKTYSKSWIPGRVDAKEKYLLAAKNVASTYF